MKEISDTELAGLILYNAVFPDEARMNRIQDHTTLKSRARLVATQTDEASADHGRNANVVVWLLTCILKEVIMLLGELGHVGRLMVTLVTEIVISSNRGWRVCFGGGATPPTAPPRTADASQSTENREFSVDSNAVQSTPPAAPAANRFQRLMSFVSTKDIDDPNTLKAFTEHASKAK